MLELQAIIATNVDSCRHWSLSGLFLYLNKSCLKLVEGPRDQIDVYLTLSETNTWHSRSIVVSKDPIEQKLFTDDLVAYKLDNVTDLTVLQEYWPVRYLNST